MTKTYTIKGLTCEACEYAVKFMLEKVPGVLAATADRTSGTVTLDAETPLAIESLQQALAANAKYSISEQAAAAVNAVAEEKTWLQTYKPVVLVFAYILAVCALVEVKAGEFSVMRSMGNFMAGFFLVFSFFKMLNIRGFASSFRMYDPIAAVSGTYALAYPFIELGLGIAFLFIPGSVWLNVLTALIMGIGLAGVMKSVLNKTKIKCACLGDVFDLPMSTLTIVENSAMIFMSGFMMVKGV
ncbi:MAG: heavy-metal-associated domain-containing protein [Bacteroidota bacterium]